MAHVFNDASVQCLCLFPGSWQSYTIVAGSLAPCSVFQVVTYKIVMHFISNILAPQINENPKKYNILVISPLT